MAITAAVLEVVAKADVRDAESGLDRLGSKVGSVAGIIAKASIGAGIGLAGLGAAGVKMAGDLQQSVANISTIKPEIDTSAVFNSLNEMQRRVPQTAQQLGDSLYNVFSSIDVSVGGGLELVEKFAKGAVGAGTSAETFGTAALGVMNAYKLSVADADHISDVFFNTVNKGVVTGQELASSLGPVTQSAKAAGLSLDDLGGFIAGVTKEGGPASENINNLNNFLQKITTKEAQKAIGDLGVRTVDSTGKFRPMVDILGDLKPRLEGMTEAARNNAIQKIFPDAQARIGAMTLMSQLDAVKEVIDENRTSFGAADAAYMKMSRTFNAQTALLKNTFLSLLTTVGANVLPMLTPLLAFFAARLPGAFAAFEQAARATVGRAQTIFRDLGQIVGAAVGLELNDYKAGWDTWIGSIRRAIDLVRPIFDQAREYVTAWAESLRGTLTPIAAGLRATLQDIGAGIVRGFQAAAPTLRQVADVLTNQIVPKLLILARVIAVELGPALARLGTILGPLVAHALPLLANGLLLLVRGISEGLDLMLRFTAALEAGDPAARALGIALLAIVGYVGGMMALEQAISTVQAAIVSAEKSASAMHATLTKLNTVLNPMAGGTGRIITAVTDWSRELTRAGGVIDDVRLRWLLFSDALGRGLETARTGAANLARTLAGLGGRAVGVTVSGLDTAQTAIQNIATMLGGLASKTFALTADTSLALPPLTDLRIVYDALRDKTVTVTVQPGAAVGGETPEAQGASFAAKFALGFGGAIAGAMGTALVAGMSVLGAGAVLTAGAALGSAIAGAIAGTISAELQGMLGQKVSEAIDNASVPSLDIDLSLSPQIIFALDVAGQVAERAREALGDLSISDIAIALTFGTIDLPGFAVLVAGRIPDVLRDLSVSDIPLALTFALMLPNLPQMVIDHVLSLDFGTLRIGPIDLPISFNVLIALPGFGAAALVSAISTALGHIDIDLPVSFRTAVLQVALEHFALFFGSTFLVSLVSSSDRIKGAFQSIVDFVAGAFTSGMSILSGIVGTAGKALDGAAAAARSLASGIDQTVGAADRFIGKAGGLIGKLLELADAARKLPLVPGSETELEQGINQTARASMRLGGEWARLAAIARDFKAAMADDGSSAGSFTSLWAQNLESLGAQAAQVRAATAAMKPWLDALRVERLLLLDTAPFTAEYAAREENIKILQAEITKHRERIALMKEDIAAFKAAATALEGFNEAQAAMTEGGKFLSPIQVNLGKAISGDDPASGAALFASIQKMIDEATKRAIPAAANLGGAILDAAAAALANPTAENIQAVLSGAQSLFGAITQAADAEKAAAVFNSENLIRAAVDAVTRSDMRDRMGTAGANLFAAFAESIEKGTPQALEKAGAAVAAVQDQLKNLPNFVRGQLGTDFLMAWQQFAAAPNDPSVKAALDAALTGINTALAVLPRDFEKLGPEIREAAIRALGQVNAGALTVEQAVERIKGITSLIPKDLAKMAPEVRSAIAEIVRSYEEGALGAEEATARITAANQAHIDSLKALKENALAELAEINNARKQQAQELQRGIEEGRRLSIQEISRESAYQIGLAVGAGRGGGPAQMGAPFTPRGGGGGGGTAPVYNITINVEGSVTSERDLALTVRDRLIEFGRRNGGTGL